MGFKKKKGEDYPFPDEVMVYHARPVEKAVFLAVTTGKRQAPY